MFNRFPFLFLTCSFLSCWSQGYGQTIVDPCFSSISPLGFFNDSEDIINLCRCPDNHIASDLLEWDGTVWQGRLNSYPSIDLPPPSGCNSRALFMGFKDWTINGEAFALRLDKPLELNKTYTFTFTYAKDGNPSADFNDLIRFSPVVYTDRSKPSLWDAHKVGRLPGALGWETHSITFKANLQQAGDEWIILHAIEVSGMVLSKCNIENPIKKNFDKGDTTICIGDALTLQADVGKDYTYLWNTGKKTSAIMVTTPGLYTVEIQYGTCNNADSITVQTEDCEVRMLMPNFFTPNDDDRNLIFEPMEYNYIESGEIVIYNRWGKLLFKGDLFQGWDGKLNGGEAPTGVYYYAIHYRDRKKNKYSNKGLVTLAR